MWPSLLTRQLVDSMGNAQCPQRSPSPQCPHNCVFCGWQVPSSQQQLGRMEQMTSTWKRCVNGGPRRSCSRSQRNAVDQVHSPCDWQGSMYCLACVMPAEVGREAGTGVARCVEGCFNMWELSGELMKNCEWSQCQQSNMEHQNVT